MSFFHSGPMGRVLMVRNTSPSEGSREARRQPWARACACAALSSAAPVSLAALNGLSMGQHPHPEERSFGTRFEGRCAHACCEGLNSNCPASDFPRLGRPLIWAHNLVANNLQEQLASLAGPASASQSASTNEGST